MLSIVRRYRERDRRSLTYPVLLKVLLGGLLIAIISTGLVACVSSSGSAQNSTPTPPATAQKCGQVQIGPNGALLNAAKVQQIENCFWQAYQHCQPASIIYWRSSVDTGVIRTFSTENKNGKCVLSDAMQHYMAPNPSSLPQTYTCTGMTLQSDGLHVTSCGEDGDIIIPLRTIGIGQ
jgi:hypothetical protein